jgi:hypothetical protein
MIFYDEYSDVPKEIIERFVTDQQLGSYKGCGVWCW